MIRFGELRTRWPEPACPPVRHDGQERLRHAALLAWRRNGRPFVFGEERLAGSDQLIVTTLTSPLRLQDGHADIDGVAAEQDIGLAGSDPQPVQFDLLQESGRAGRLKRISFR